MSSRIDATKSDVGKGNHGAFRLSVYRRCYRCRTRISQSIAGGLRDFELSTIPLRSRITFSDDGAETRHERMWDTNSARRSHQLGRRKADPIQRRFTSQGARKSLNAISDQRFTAEYRPCRAQPIWLVCRETIARQRLVRKPSRPTNISFPW